MIKFTINKANFKITHNQEFNYDINVIFSFENKLLANAKYLFKNELNLNLIDLTKAGNYCILNSNNQNFLIISLGNQKDLSYETYLQALKSLSYILSNNSHIESANITLENSLIADLKIDINKFNELCVTHILNYLYFFDEQKSQIKKIKLNLINFNCKTMKLAHLENSVKIAKSIVFLKHLANNPANIVTPSYIANEVKKFSKLSKKVKVTILDKKDIEKENMNAFLAVSQGSNEAPKFIILEYYNGKKNDKPVVLIGKGITFDSGGISIKPSLNMDAMKYDMCGAATVISLFLATVELKLEINLIVLVPTCENMPSGTAIKPGDVVKTRSKQTVEILNTDAEGRLILCDALDYAKEYKPKLVIDVATLTGGCVIALGTIASGMYSNDETIANNLMKSADNTHDKIWRMPLFKEYHEMLKSVTADIANIAGWKGQASSSTAACFLEKFVDYPWAHLDIAGTANGDSIFNSINYQGATARPFYMLLDYLRNNI